MRPASLHPTPAVEQAVRELREGVRYLVLYAHQAGNYRWGVRGFVGVFLGHHDNGVTAQLDWSLRPSSGTSALAPGDVLALVLAGPEEANGLLSSARVRLLWARVEASRRARARRAVQP